LWCSATGRGDAPAGRTIEYQDTWLHGGGVSVIFQSFPSPFSTVIPPKDPANPGTNRDLGVGNPTGIAPVVNDQTQAPFVTPHAVRTDVLTPIYPAEN